MLCDKHTLADDRDCWRCRIAELEAKVERLEKELVSQTAVLQDWYDYGYDRNQNERLLFGNAALEGKQD